MDINSMMSAVQQQESRRVATGLAASRGNGISTAATAITGAGSKLARSGPAASMAASAPRTTASSTSSTNSSSSNITSNDFLTLLVSEMQNQDPTQPTDPNAYIQQLVQVNSLQQLISINSELATATGSTPPTTGGAHTGPAVGGATATATNQGTLSTIASSVGATPVQGWLPPLADG